jgi:fatty acid hydroxylase domain-containing protein 2
VAMKKGIVYKANEGVGSRNGFNLALMAIFFTGYVVAGDNIWGYMSQWTAPQYFLGFLGGLYFTITWLIGGFYLLVDLTKKPSYIYRRKIQTGLKTREQNLTKFKKKVPKLCWVVLRNQLFGSIPFTIAYMYCFTWRGQSMSDPLPAWYVSLGLLLVVAVMQGFLFYVGHYIFHFKSLYRKYHKIHHEFRESTALACQYAHLVEHYLVNLLPIMVPPLIVGLHPFVFAFWFSIAVVTTNIGHSGYSIPHMGTTILHDFHHFNVFGNYGTGDTWDKAFKTDKEFKEFLNRDS